MMMSSELRKYIRSLARRSYSVADTMHRVRSRKRKKSNRRFLKGHVWDSYDNQFNLNKLMDNKENIFLGVSDVEDLITAEIMKRRIESNKTTVQRETTVLCNREKWSHWAEQYFSDCLFSQTSSSSGFIVEPKEQNFIKFSVNSNSTEVRAFGDADFADSIVEAVEDAFSVVTSYIEWVYSGDGNSVNVPLNRDRLPTSEMYPFLKGKSLEEYYDEYMESSANILLLIGPPGTGKTTFIRGLLAHTNSSAIVSYDSNILDKDGFFARFIEDDASIMVLEDSDNFLRSRSDGNNMMHRFLNVGDGLVTTKGKKMIFSTNLPSIRDIDSALVRPGRCFDIVHFDVLSESEANALAKKLGVNLPASGDGKYSIAEIFNQQKQSTVKKLERKVGFV